MGRVLPNAPVRRTAVTSSHTVHDAHTHTHGPDCGHATVEHDDHRDYLHDGHRHAEHDGHYDEH
jgi:hypothetical protein